MYPKPPPSPVIDANGDRPPQNVHVNHNGNISPISMYSSMPGPPPATNNATNRVFALPPPQQQHVQSSNSTIGSRSPSNNLHHPVMNAHAVGMAAPPLPLVHKQMTPPGPSPPPNHPIQNTLQQQPPTRPVRPSSGGGVPGASNMITNNNYNQQQQTQQGRPAFPPAPQSGNSRPGMAPLPPTPISWNSHSQTAQAPSFPPPPASANNVNPMHFPASQSRPMPPPPPVSSGGMSQISQPSRQFHQVAITPPPASYGSASVGVPRPPPPPSMPHNSSIPPPPSSFGSMGAQKPPPPPLPGGHMSPVPPVMQQQQHYQNTPAYPPMQQPGYSAAPQPPRPAYPQPPMPQMPPPNTGAPSLTNRKASTGHTPVPVPTTPLFTRPQEESDEACNPIIYYPKSAMDATMPDDILVPPSADSRFVVQDDGNASPQLLRSTTYQFPQNRSVWHNAGDFPLGIVCTPMAVGSADFTPRPRLTWQGQYQDWTEFGGGVPLVVSGDGTNPPRCSTCGAYVNPYFGSSGVCNLCGSRNRGLDLTGLPMQCGTVEYQVSGPYVVRDEPIQPISLYAIDLTSMNVVQYLSILERVAQDMLMHVQRQPDAMKWKPKIGFCFYCVAGIILRHRSITDPGHPARYVIVPDVLEDPFSPLPIDEWTFDVSSEEEFQVFQYIIEEIKNDLDMLKKDAQRKRQGLDGLELSCGGAAAGFLADALRATGGRGTILTNKRPNFGVGKLQYRDQELERGGVKGIYTTSTPLQLQGNKLGKDEKEAAEYYASVAADCCNHRVAISVVYHTGTGGKFLDIATLAELCRKTCGNLHWVNSQEWEENIYQELTSEIQSFTVSDAVFKLRTSAGVQVNAYHTYGGNVIEANLSAAEVELPWVTSRSTISVDLEHRVGGIPKHNHFTYVQSALLYTALNGSRRVRVSTLAIRTTSSASGVFLKADFTATSTMLLREAATRLWKPQGNAAEDEKEQIRSSTRDGLFHRCVLLLANYRQFSGAVTVPPSELALPERLQLLPLFIMSMMKCPMLRPGAVRRLGENPQPVISPSGDERAFFTYHASRCTPATSMLLVHPSIYPVINNDNPQIGEWTPYRGSFDGHGFVRMPAPKTTSITALEDSGVYFIDNGLNIYLIVEKQAPDNFRQSLQEIAAKHPKVANMIWQLRSFSSAQKGQESDIRATFAVVIPVFLQEGRHGKIQMDVLNLMIDDAVGGEKNASDFIGNLQRTVRERYAWHIYSMSPSPIKYEAPFHDIPMKLK